MLIVLYGCHHSDVSQRHPSGCTHSGCILLFHTVQVEYSPLLLGLYRVKLEFIIIHIGLSTQETKH